MGSPLNLTVRLSTYSILRTVCSHTTRCVCPSTEEVGRRPPPSHCEELSPDKMLISKYGPDQRRTGPDFQSLLHGLAGEMRM